MIIKLISYEDKITKNNKPYKRFKSIDGKWYSVFDEALIASLVSNIGKKIDVFMVNDGDYSNIKSFIGVVEESQNAPMNENIENPTLNNVPVIKVNGNEKINQPVTTIVYKTERANSYEFGKAGNRFKIYFEDALDLSNQIKNLKDTGLYVDDTESLIA